MGLGVGVEIAAVGATVLATVGAVPQLRRVLVTGDAAGVSSCAAGLGVATEATWIGYAISGGLWAVVPEASLMLTSNVLLLVVLVRSAVDIRLAASVGGVWLSVLGSAAAVGGSAAVAAVLAVAYAVEMTPAVWSVYRTSAPTGVAPATWAIVLAESLLWGLYGIGHGDPANISFGVVGAVASSAILVRTVASGAAKMSRCPS